MIRLKIARLRRKKTIKDLANLANLTELTVSNIEKNRVTPTHETITTLSTVLNFPIAFLYGGNIDFADKNEVNFRSLKSMRARDRDAALGAASIGFMVTDWLKERGYLNYPLHSLELPYEIMSDPEYAAEYARNTLGLGDRPILNMISLLELNGISVFSLVEDSLAVDAFSTWRDGSPYIFLNTMKTAERSRFDAAHELAHLFMHRSIGDHAAAEKEANAFAGAFLMPQGPLRKKFFKYGPINITDLMDIKRVWGVSLSALVYRLKELDIMKEWETQVAYAEINHCGWRNSEPYPIEPDCSILWSDTLKHLWNRKKASRHIISKELNIPEDELNKLLSGLVPNNRKNMFNKPHEQRLSEVEKAFMKYKKPI